ncbi:MAG TPA: glycosyltransferase family 39 protein [Longimicrobiales bacterium]|nr:glycosyltransferase family 39 protein [Longimicrobiales bacterium]
MKRAITVTLASARRVLSPQLAVFLLAVVCSLGFSFIIYPAIASPQNAVLDPDRYGALGFGLWHHGTLSYYPDPQPTLDRGPIYPAVIAVILWLSGGVWPQSLQAAQAVFFGLTSVLVFYIGEKVWGRRTAMAAAALTTVHPFLLWYTSRVWIETLATLLFTALAASLVFFHERPGIRRGMLVGAVAGVATLCKATFLPFLLFVPMVLL